MPVETREGGAPRPQRYAAPAKAAPVPEIRAALRAGATADFSQVAIRKDPVGRKPGRQLRVAIGVNGRRAVGAGCLMGTAPSREERIQPTPG